MSTSDKNVFVDQEVGNEVISLINEAQRNIVIVTAYLKLDGWQHAQRALVQAMRRGVDVTFIVRLNDEWVENQSVAWLQQNKVKVLALENLHAKIYQNENRTLISSMNLHTFSANNSLEIAMVIQTQEDDRKIRAYVKSLIETAQPCSLLLETASHRQSPRDQIAHGSCIRCGREIGLNPSRPLCDSCYDSWAEYENEDYPEKFCHACGKPRQTSYAKPLCWTCFQKLA